MSTDRGKTILLSSHPDDADRITGVDTLPDGYRKVGRHLLPHRGENRPHFMKAQLVEWCSDAECAVVLITGNTAGCTEVAEDIKACCTYPLGVVGLRLEGALSPSPSGCCVEQALWEGGFEVVDNDPEEIEEALERTKRLARTMRKIRSP